MVYGGGGSNVGVAMPLGKSTSLAPGCLPAHCRKAQKFTRLFDAFAGPNAVRPDGTQKKFFFPTFEAGMLLKTNEARNIRAANNPICVMKTNHLSKNAYELLKMQEIA